MVKLRVPKFLKSVRYCLAAINGLFVLTGLLVLIIGITVLVKNGQYDLFVTSRFSTLPGFVVATGVIILLASALGFYGAHSEQFYFVAGYTIATLVVLVFEVAIVIAGFGLKSDAVAEIRQPMVTALAQYENDRDIAMTWDSLQRDFECCGVTGRHDWPINRVPISCCIMDYGQISPFECNTANAHTVGCASVLGEQLSYNAHLLASTVLFVLCLQVLISGAAAWLTYRIKFEEVELES